MREYENRQLMEGCARGEWFAITVQGNRGACPLPRGMNVYECAQVETLIPSKAKRMDPVTHRIRGYVSNTIIGQRRPC